MNDLFTIIGQMLQERTASDSMTNDFMSWYADKIWNEYNNEYMDKIQVIKTMVNDLKIVFPNGTVGKDYSASVSLNDANALFEDFHFEGLAAIGVESSESETSTPDNRVITFAGKPTESGSFDIKLVYKPKGWLEGIPIEERVFTIAINPDPRTLWKDIPTSKDVPYYKPDATHEYIKVESGENGSSKKDIVAASMRGRSHANEGKPRDDHFDIYHCDESDWYIMAVADGAGSAKFSRKGSQVACETVMSYCKEKLRSCPDFETAISSYNVAKSVGEEAELAARKSIGDFVYDIIGRAAFQAHKAISETSSLNEGSKVKDFATTLLLSICKKFDFGWFIASYWVGDGAICLYNKEQHIAKILGIPDEGEFAGQTRFLTMPEIFKDASTVYNRLRFSIEEDFTALMLMTDGVSDPMFETGANLMNPDKWDAFWETLKNGFPNDNIPGVELTDDNEASQEQLLNWLNFWAQGNHDDRTIAILY